MCRHNLDRRLTVFTFHNNVKTLRNCYHLLFFTNRYFRCTPKQSTYWIQKGLQCRRLFSAFLFLIDLPCFVLLCINCKWLIPYSLFLFPIKHVKLLLKLFLHLFSQFIASNWRLHLLSRVWIFLDHLKRQTNLIFRRHLLLNHFPFSHFYAWFLG